MKQYHHLAALSLSLVFFGFQKVDVNEASPEQIALLTGIGDGFARQIVSLREARGGRLSKEELMRMPGMSKKKFDGISPHIVFGQAKEKKKGPLPTELKTLAKPAVIGLGELESIMLKSIDLQRDLEEDLSRRARRAGMVPRVSLNLDIDRDEDKARKRHLNKDETLERGGLDLGFGIRVLFDLPDLVFNKAELEIVNLAHKRQDRREQAIIKLHDKYFRYLKLLEAAQTPSTNEIIKGIEFQLRELAAAIDNLTQGAFSRYQQGHESGL